MQSRRSSRSSTKRQRLEQEGEANDIISFAEGNSDTLVTEIKRLRQELTDQINENMRLSGELKEQIRRNEELQEQVDNAQTSEGPKKSQSRYWSKEEHQRFLEALEKYGRKDVKSISAYVGSRTPTQVRTHAQKYFLKLQKGDDMFPSTPQPPSKKRKLKDMDKDDLSPPGSPSSPESPRSPIAATATSATTTNVSHTTPTTNKNSLGHIIPPPPPLPPTPYNSNSPNASSSTATTATAASNNTNSRNNVYMFPATYNRPTGKNAADERKILSALKEYEQEKDYTTKLELIQKHYFPQMKIEQIHALAVQSGGIPSSFQPTPQHKHLSFNSEHSSVNSVLNSVQQRPSDNPPPDLPKPVAQHVSQSAASATSSNSTDHLFPPWQNFDIKQEFQPTFLTPKTERVTSDHHHSPLLRSIAGAIGIPLIPTSHPDENTPATSSEIDGHSEDIHAENSSAENSNRFGSDHSVNTGIIGRSSIPSPIPIPTSVPSPSPLTSSWAVHNNDIYSQKLYSPISMWLAPDHKNDGLVINSSSLLSLAETMDHNVNDNHNDNNNTSTPSGDFPVLASAPQLAPLSSISSTGYSLNALQGDEDTSRNSLAEDEEDEELRELNKHHKRPQQQQQNNNNNNINNNNNLQLRKTSLQDVIGGPVAIPAHIFAGSLDSTFSTSASSSASSNFSSPSSFSAFGTAFM